MKPAWRIKTRDVADPTYVFNEEAFPSEKEARANFERGRIRAEEHGGSAVLLNEKWEAVASYSHWAKND